MQTKNIPKIVFYLLNFSLAMWVITLNAIFWWIFWIIFAIFSWYIIAIYIWSIEKIREILFVNYWVNNNNPTWWDHVSTSSAVFGEGLLSVRFWSDYVQANDRQFKWEALDNFWYEIRTVSTITHSQIIWYRYVLPTKIENIYLFLKWMFVKKEVKEFSSKSISPVEKKDLTFEEWIEEERRKNKQ